MTLRRRLEQRGHLPTVAVHAHGAVEQLAAHPEGWSVVAIVLEARPQRGLDLARSVLEGFPDIGVVVLSAGGSEAALPVELAGASFVRIPYTVEALDTALAEAVSATPRGAGR
jgi:ActR/RegA family two-component response regulator